MSRRTARTLILGAVALAVLAAGVWLALPHLAERMIAGRLAALGLGPAQVDVARIDLGGARLNRLVTEDGALEVGAVDVRWSALRQDIDAVVVEDVTLRGRWTADGGLDLGPLADLLTGGTGSADDGGVALPVERLELRRARAEIALPDGLLTATVAGSLSRAAPGPAVDLIADVTAPGLSGTLTFAGTAAGTGALPVAGDGWLRLTADGFAAPGVAGAVDGSLAAAVRLGADSIAVGAEGPVEVTLRDLAPDLAEAVAALATEASETPVMALRLTATDGGVPSFTVAGLADAGDLTVATDGLRLTAEAGRTTATLAAAGSVALGADGPAASLRDVSASLDRAVVAGIPASVTLTDASLTASAAGVAAEGAVQVEAAGLPVEGVRADRVALDGRLRLTLQPDGTGALFAERGTLTAEGFALPDQEVAAAAPLSLTLAETEAPLLRLTRPTDTGGALHATLTAAFEAPDLDLRAPLAGAVRPVRAAFAGLEVTAEGPLTAFPSTLRADASGGSVSAMDIAADAVSLTASLGADGPSVDLTAQLDRLPGEPADLAAASALRPFLVSLSARPGEAEDGRLALSATVLDAAKARLLSADGWLDPSDGSGRLRLDMPRQVFDPQGLKPGDLYATLGTFAHGISGSVAVDGSIGWSAAGTLAPDLRVLLRDVTLTQGFVTLNRINGVLNLTGLDPLRTPPGQEVSVAVIEAGVPITDAVADFQISGNRLHLDRAVARLANGTLSADPTSLPLDLEGGSVTLRVRDLDMTPLINLFDIQGLSADGTLAGEIPLQIAGGDILITQAVLRSQGPDTLSYDPEDPPPALSGSGESVGMVLEALKNFQYTVLRLTVDGRASGALTLGLHIAGSNPDFYDGYPVEFNLTVSGDLAQAVQAGLQGYRVPDRIRERMQEFAQ